MLVIGWFSQELANSNKWNRNQRGHSYVGSSFFFQTENVFNTANFQGMQIKNNV